MSTKPRRIAVLLTALVSLLCHASAAEDKVTVAEKHPDESVKNSVDDFDYFVNNWNVIGLKDYVDGSRVTPDNQLLLANKTLVQVRIGPERKPLSRENPKRALHGWMPIIVVTADDGPVHYEITYWATPLPNVTDWIKAFDWPTEGENFLTWIWVKATNTSDVPVAAGVDIGPHVPAQTPQPPSRRAHRPMTRVCHINIAGPGGSRPANQPKGLLATRSSRSTRLALRRGRSGPVAATHRGFLAARDRRHCARSRCPAARPPRRCWPPTSAS